jgi:hypothetical protein
MTTPFKAPQYALGPLAMFAHAYANHVTKYQGLKPLMFLIHPLILRDLVIASHSMPCEHYELNGVPINVDSDQEQPIMVTCNGEVEYL